MITNIHWAISKTSYCSEQLMFGLLWCLRCQFCTHLQGHVCAGTRSLLCGGPALLALRDRPGEYCRSGGGGLGRGYASWPNRPMFKAFWPQAIDLGSRAAFLRAGGPSEYPLAHPPTTSLSNLPAMQETWVQSLGQEDIPWRREWLPTPIFSPGKFHEQRNLAGYSPWACKELDMAEWLSHTQSFQWQT